MIYKIDFVPSVSKVIAKYKKSNQQVYKKLEKLLHDIQMHPREGIGHPEPLVGGNDITYSRHITASNRIIYDIHDETIMIVIVDIDKHYNDK